MEFLNEYHLAGLFIGICTFLIIGLFHPVVVKAEYYWGTKCWWIFLVLGIAGVIASLSIDNVILSSLLGVFAFSSFWTRRRSLLANSARRSLFSRSISERMRWISSLASTRSSFFLASPAFSASATIWRACSSALPILVSAMFLRPK